MSFNGSTPVAVGPSVDAGAVAGVVVAARSPVVAVESTVIY
jgi:hypothetical protein